MHRGSGSYLAATRHPWASLVFLLPLLVLYEAGVVWLGGTQPEALRNGADTWLRWGLESFGLSQLYCAPALILCLLLAAGSVSRRERPESATLVFLGMALESMIFALGLWGLSRNLGPLLDGMGIHLALPAGPQTLKRLITFVGAGIYEELLFRLLLFFVLGVLVRLAGLPSLLASLFIMAASAVLFAAAHHVGPYGEAFDNYIFLFRCLAGLYFALLYQLRGFGIAAGAHACYDVIVGVLMVT